MYNLLVTSNVGAWDVSAYEFDRERFGEHTAETLVDRFKKLMASKIEELKSFPALFAYEGQKKIVRVGYIRRIKERGKSLLVEYEFEEDILPFNFSEIADLKVQLDIDKSEMNRTHWAIKDENLLEVLASAGIAKQAFVNQGNQPGRVEEIRFKVALSFPGEQRDYVAAVVGEIKKRLGTGSVFYDKDFTAQLARPNLDILLQKIYLNNSDLVVIFVSEDYERKQWCGIEWRAIRNIIMNKSDQYRTLVSSLPRPTCLQMQQFACWSRTRTAGINICPIFPLANPFSSFSTPEPGCSSPSTPRDRSMSSLVPSVDSTTPGCRPRSTEIDSAISPIAGL